MNSVKKPPGAAGPVEVKKVSPYPIAVTLTREANPQPLTAQIVKLTDFGFLMQFDQGPIFKVNDNWNADFKIPAVGALVSTGTKVIKTYDAAFANAGAATTRVYTIEMHFRNLDLEDKRKIQSFISQIGQK